VSLVVDCFINAAECSDCRCWLDLWSHWQKHCIYLLTSARLFVELNSRLGVNPCRRWSINWFHSAGCVEFLISAAIRRTCVVRYDAVRGPCGLPLPAEGRRGGLTGSWPPPENMGYRPLFRQSLFRQNASEKAELTLPLTPTLTLTHCITHLEMSG